MGKRRRPSLRGLCCLLWGSALLGGAFLLPSVPAAQTPATRPAAPETATGGPGAAAAASAPAGRLDLQADRLVYRIIDGRKITFLYGHVRVVRDTLTALADSARHYPDRDLYELYGDVRLQTPSSLVTAARASYDRRRQAADFFGDVTVREPDLTGTGRTGQSRQDGQVLRLIGEARLTAPDYVVWGDTIVQDRLSGRGEADGDVRIVDPQSHSLVTGEHASFAAGGDLLVVDRRPVLTSREQGRQTLEASSRLMNFYRQDQRVVMLDSVRIRQGPTRAQADTAISYGRDRLVLRGSPRVQSGPRSTMTARSIEFLYRDQQLERILLQGAALMEDTSPDSLAARFAGLPQLDRLNGDTIVVEVQDDEVRRTTVYGGARSVYVPDDVEDEVAFNEVGGDTITLDFDAGRVQRVRVQGGMSGVYTFAERGDLVPVAPPAPVETPGGPVPAGADSAAAPDTTGARAAAAADTAAMDFKAASQRVDYSGRAVSFDLARRTIEIDGEAQVVYGDMTLTARHIRMRTDDKELYARGQPLLIEGDQKLVGDVMGYDFDYRSGAVRDGVTAYDRNFYDGDEIKRYGDGTLKIRSGTMTACDLQEPHYSFWADEMKLQLKDKVVARPVVMKVGKVPVFALPFYFKSLKEGRRSGILFPQFNFGWSQRTGRYVRDFGYYWAASDYFDFIVDGDYNERQEFTYRISNAYVKRYAFNGNLTYARKLYLGDRQGQREWQLDWRHDQPRFLDEYRLSASAHLASRTLTSNYLTTDVGRSVVSGELQSRLSLSRNWDAVTVSLGLSRNEYPNAGDDDLATDKTVYTQTLPSLNVSFRQLNLMSDQAARGRGLLAQLASRTTFSQAYTLNRARTRRELTATDVTQATGSWGLDFRSPRLWILDFGSRVSGSQFWSRTQTTGRSWVEQDGSLEERSADSILEETTPRFTVGSSVSTSLYGIFPLGIGPLAAMRHNLRVGVTHAWQPAIGSQRQGQSFAFSVANRLDLKLRQAAGDTFQERKIDGVLDWNLGASYDPDAPERRWSTISSGLNIRPGQSRNLALRVDNTIDPYKWTLLTTSLSYSLALDGRFDTGESPAAVEAERNEIVERLGMEADSTGTQAPAEGIVPADRRYPGQLDDPTLDGAPTGAGMDRDEGDGRFLPWHLGASISINRDRRTDQTSARGNLTASLALTPNWDFAYNASLDFSSGQMLGQSWSLRRDLHCWALEFNRTVYAGQSLGEFGFRLYLKSIPAVKLTRGKEDLLGVAGALGSGALF